MSSHNQNDSQQGFYQYVLKAYNAAQTLGWGYVLAVSIMLLVSGEFHLTYSYLSSVVNFIQIAAFFEVFNSIMGLSRSDPLTAFLQWAGRTHCLVMVLGNAPEEGVQDHWSVLLLFLAWSGIEVVRYPLYLFKSSPLLSWLRYTLFIPLYPMGVIGEIAITKLSVPYFKETRLFSVSLPNRINWSFRYDIFLLVAIYTLYPILFPRMYWHMFKQRAKKLGGKKSKHNKRD